MRVTFSRSVSTGKGGGGAVYFRARLEQQIRLFGGAKRGNLTKYSTVEPG